MDRLLGEFIADLEQVGSSDEAWSIAAIFFEKLGLGFLVYGYASSSQPSTGIAGMRNNNPEAMRSYTEKGAHRYDPALLHCQRSLEPFVHGPDFTDPERDGVEWCRHMEEARHITGCHSGVLFPMGRRRATMFGGFFLGAPMHRPEFLRFAEAQGRMLQLAAFCLDARIVELDREEAERAIRLSARERECLLWLSRGLRNERIAERIGISPPTVELHLANARRKLAADTREQALARAIMLGIITP